MSQGENLVGDVVRRFPTEQEMPQQARRGTPGSCKQGVGSAEPLTGYPSTRPHRATADRGAALGPVQSGDPPPVVLNQGISGHVWRCFGLPPLGWGMLLAPSG